MENNEKESLDNKEEKEKLNEFFDLIDNADYLPDEMVEDMDFYQLSSYIQTLNTLDFLTPEEEVKGDE